MQPNKRPTVDEILKKYGSKIEGEIKTTELGAVKDSKSYLKFKEEREMELTNYERWCKTLGSVIKMNPSKKDEEKIRRDIEIAHMNIEPWQAITLSVVIFLLVFFLGIVLSAVCRACRRRLYWASRGVASQARFSRRGPGGT